ncbi:hypothetical protein ACQEU3_21920 [Spirillospora sp. CA-253888]
MRIALAAALIGAYACLTVAEGPIVVGPHEMYPDLPRDLEERASGPRVTDGTYLAGTLPSGVYVPVRGDRCRFETFDRLVTTRLYAVQVRVGREPAEPARKIIKSHRRAFVVVSDHRLGPTSYAFGGGCVWRRVGSPDDALPWSRPPYFDRETWKRMYGL